MAHILACMCVVRLDAGVSLNSRQTRHKCCPLKANTATLQMSEILDVISLSSSSERVIRTKRGFGVCVPKNAKNEMNGRTESHSISNTATYKRQESARGLSEQMACGRVCLSVNVLEVCSCESMSFGPSCLCMPSTSNNLSIYPSVQMCERNCLRAIHHCCCVSMWIVRCAVVGVDVESAVSRLQSMYVCVCVCLSRVYGPHTELI